MRRLGRWVWAMVLISCGLAPVVEGTPDAGGELPRCIPGRVESCACAGQPSGAQTCLADGTFGACECGTAGCQPGQLFGCACPLGGVGARACGSDVCSGCAPITDGGSGTNSGVVLYAGEDTLVDFFPVQAGLIVVRSTVVQLLDPQGTELARVDSPREITAAAFDGTHLGVADRALLTVYDERLVPQRTAALIESCGSAVIVSGHRFVCGPFEDWDRIFSVFDLATGQLLRHGPEKFTYHGVPMRQVPGTDDFITVTVGTSPADFYLYRVDPPPASGVVSYGDSPYHGAFPVDEAYAFDAVPAQHVITSTGIMLAIYTPGCVPATFGGGCFVRDGELGTLPANSYFLAMAEGAPGTVYGVVDPRGYSGLGWCTQGCDVQRIDVGARVVRGNVQWTGNVGQVVRARFDPFRQQLLLGYREYDLGNPAPFHIAAFAP